MSGNDWARGALRGVENITVPSFDREFRGLDEDGIRWDVRQAVAHGFASTLVACDAGLSVAEMKRFVDIAVDEARARLHVGVAAPTDSPAIAREVLVHAERAGASHALLGYPLTLAAADAEALHAAFAELCGATDLAIVLPVGDDVDVRAIHPSNVPFGVLDRLVSLPNVVGLRVATPDPAPLFEAYRRYSERLVVGAGSPLLLGAFQMLHRHYGAQWLAGAHWELWQSPRQRHVVEYVEAVLAGRADEARERYWRVAPALGIAMGAGLAMPEVAGMPHWPLAKYVSWSVGGNGGLTRDPAMRLKEHQIGARRAMLGALGIAPPDEPYATFAAGRAQAPSAR